MIIGPEIDIPLDHLALNLNTIALTSESLGCFYKVCHTSLALFVSESAINNIDFSFVF